jgi:multidrug efflux pump subunit AcrB
VVAATFGLLVLSIVGLAGSVQKQFFPSSDRPEVLIDIGGAVEQSGKADASIQRVQPIMLALMLIVVMLQMRSFSGTLMVVATAPLGVIGATLAVLIADRPFGFVALLVLAGILMRNTLILAKQIEDNLHRGLERSAAVVEATV